MSQTWSILSIIFSKADHRLAERSQRQFGVCEFVSLKREKKLVAPDFYVGRLYFSTDPTDLLIGQKRRVLNFMTSPKPSPEKRGEKL